MEEKKEARVDVVLVHPCRHSERYKNSADYVIEHRKK